MLQRAIPKVLAAVSKELAIVIAGAGVRWFKLLTTTVAEGTSLYLIQFYFHFVKVSVIMSSSLKALPHKDC